MIDAIICNWDDKTMTGIARSANGRSYRIRYIDGESFASSAARPIPVLTGRHVQVADGTLKVPAIGDPVLIQTPPAPHAKVRWGYMRHYLDMVEERFGTRFLPRKHVG